MDKKKSFVLAASVILLVGLFVCNERVNAEDPSSQLIQPIPGKSESEVNGVKIVYYRNSEGCVDKCQFWNDPARCGDNPECAELVKDEKAEFIDCLAPKTKPEIAGEPVRWAGDMSDNVDQTCTEFRILTYGSPGWIWQYISGSWQLACVGGYYYAPLELCCDAVECIPKP